MERIGASLELLLYKQRDSCSYNVAKTWRQKGLQPSQFHAQQELRGKRTRNRASSKKNNSIPDLIHCKHSLTENALSISNRTPFPTHVHLCEKEQKSKPNSSQKQPKR